MFTIRPIAPTDYAAWKPLWDGYNAFYKREGPTAVSEETTQTLWQRFFDAQEPVHGFVADPGNGQLLGTAHYLFHRSTSNIQLTCYLQDLFTAPSSRGQGVGKALIEAVAEQARLKNSGRFYWHTHETNTTARKLYDSVAENSGFLVYRKVL